MWPQVLCLSRSRAGRIWVNTRVLCRQSLERRTGHPDCVLSTFNAFHQLLSTARPYGHLHLGDLLRLFRYAIVIQCLYITLLPLSSCHACRVRCLSSFVARFLKDLTVIHEWHAHRGPADRKLDENGHADQVQSAQNGPKRCDKQLPQPFSIQRSRQSTRAREHGQGHEDIARKKWWK